MGRYRFAWTGICKPIVRQLWGVTVRVFGQISPAAANIQNLNGPKRFRRQIGGGGQKIAFFRFFCTRNVFQIEDIRKYFVKCFHTKCKEIVNTCE